MILTETAINSGMYSSKSQFAFSELNPLANAELFISLGATPRIILITSQMGAALGNYLAAKMIEFGLQDGSNESGGYGRIMSHLIRTC